ncbi:reverse transcriptase domain-containing protein [Tanacetum coccineum]
MFKYRDTENEAVRLMMFPLSLTREAKTWLDELNEGTIETWDELRTAFISRFFPPALFDRVLREIRAFSQHENESLTDAGLRMKEMLRNCHGHNLSNGNIIKIFYNGLNEITQEVLNAAAGGIFLYKTPNQAYQLLKDKVLLKLDWAKNQKTKSSLKKIVAFTVEGSSNSDTNKIMARMDAMTMKMDALDNWHSSERNNYNRDNYQSHSDDKPDLQKQLKGFIKAQHSTNSFVKDTFMDLKNKLETTTKNHQASIQNLEAKFDRLADKQSGRPSRSLPSNTQPGPKGSSSKPHQPPDDEDDEPTPQPKPKIPKLVKVTPTYKPYKLKIPYPQRLRKEKMEAQYGKFLDMIRAIRIINVPLIDVLAGMPNYGKFLKELISNKHKIEQISAAFLSDESSSMIQNIVPPKLGDPGSFLIPCNFNKTFSCNALADLGASINLMPYLLYAKISLETLKPTKADRSFQYPVGIAENMLVKVVKQKQLNLGVGIERMIFNIDSAMKHSYSNGDTCFSIDVIDEILEENFDALLSEGSKILHSIEGTLLEKEIFAEFDEFLAMTADENSGSESDTEEPPFEKITINTSYKIKTSLEEPPTDVELKPLPDNLEYVFLEEPCFLLVIISS